MHKVNCNTGGSDFGGKRVRPLLEEGLGAGVGREEWCGGQTAEGTHCQDEAVLVLQHAGKD